MRRLPGGEVRVLCRRERPGRCPGLNGIGPLGLRKGAGAGLKARDSSDRGNAPGYRRLLSVLVLSVLLGACSSPPPRHVLFILVDTLRADHLGIYGAPRNTSPALDRFARGALRFADARAQASCTFPSANSILTSRAPESFLGQPEQAMGIPAEIPSLAEILGQRGFRTVAVSASPIVRKSPTRFNPKGGFDRGFDEFDETCLWKPAACVKDRALAQLQGAREAEKPLFLYLHFMDPHGPYAPPEDFTHRFATGTSDKDFIRRGDPNPIGDMLYKGAPDPGITPADLQYLIDLYDDEIAYFDTQLDLLLQELERSGVLESTLVVLVSDHGEEFLEHGHIKHCRTLFDSLVKVPLLLRIPGIDPAVLTGPAQALDLVPTVLDYLDLDAAKLHLEGRSLRSLIEGKKPEPAHPYQYSSQGSLRAVSDTRFKLVWDLATEKRALYDLKADPGETRDVLAENRRVYGELKKALVDRLAHLESTDEVVRQAREAEKQLRALGYLE